METKTYAVAVLRTVTDYILLTAANETEAQERAELLMREGETVFSLGGDGTENQVLGAEATTVDEAEAADLAANDAAIAELQAEEGASI